MDVQFSSVILGLTFGECKHFRTKTVINVVDIVFPGTNVFRSSRIEEKVGG